MTVETQPLLQKLQALSQLAPWAKAVTSSREPSRRLPQAIAHRGAKALWPENSMAAFQGAVKAGTHALETDVHLSADGVVVLSHDPTLKRCFGVDARIADCQWEYLSGLRTTREPCVPMPRLSDLLQWLAEPPQASIWIVLDIKIDDDADELVTAIARTLSEVEGPVPWETRIVLGCWNATFLKAAHRILPAYPLAHISASLLYSRHFFAVPTLGYNLHHMALFGPSGARFLERARAADKLVLTWTVNDPRWMEWCIRKNLDAPPAAAPGLKEALLDGVITDDPRLYLDVCRQVEDELDGLKVRARTPVLQRVRESARSVFWAVAFRVLTVGFFYVRRWQGKFDYLNHRNSLEDRK